MKKAVIIGSGFSSLTAACYMAKAGYSVQVVEKNEQLGGRASMMEIDGFKFDMGPSWYWMPDVFERFFADFGKKVEDYYSLEKLTPAYRVFFGEKDSIDIDDSLEKIVDTFEHIEQGSGKILKQFIKEAHDNYQIAIHDLVYNPGRSITELISIQTAKRLHLFTTTIAKQVRSRIKDTKLRSILEFPVLFLGAKPSKTPAFYNFMNYADFGLGTWYPKGGFNAVALGIVQLAKELGVVFHINEEVLSIENIKHKVTKIRTTNKEFEADVFISGADYAHTESLLNKNRNYTPNYWSNKTFAPSSFLYYVAFNKKVKHLLHHNLFFDTDFEQHATEIYDTFEYPKKPLFYANFSSITDDTLAPEGKEIGFFLIPVAVDLNDNPAIHEKYFDIILERIKKCTGEDLKEAIIFKKSFGVNDFKQRYHSCKGNAYGLANTLLQTSVLRPRINNKKIKNFFYTGQLTVPGPGVPPALISGKVVTDYILKKQL
ncbi:phytoene dehydrogenase [Flavobacterium columnare]|uniref:phytoene desaturase family protein n=1 Tax=Flavobacterium columnare TaxID=996 RepID=UPI0007F9BC30|nr:phytoene desaturase family protein [Flavobacterium columnare]ANO48489.1 phytoene dehydrogenase [Flavobacterium columnare]APT23452.1 phytoene dehydrogenase [Flavobacterium columnare]